MLGLANFYVSYVTSSFKLWQSFIGFTRGSQVVHSSSSLSQLHFCRALSPSNKKFYSLCQIIWSPKRGIFDNGVLVTNDSSRSFTSLFFKFFQVFSTTSAALIIIIIFFLAFWMHLLFLIFLLHFKQYTFFVVE